ncbi:MAG: hypothetical protein K2X77_00690 [Candidatus Obscuribacterales bacterium]|jgi:hypothetical protein|nr:hypothetical protein [Candidatus Obscuribacterales bacterium]
MAEMIPSNLDRVRRSTAPEVNDEIDRQIERNIRLLAQKPPAVLDARIRDLELEWDIERVLEAMAASFAFVGTLLGAFVNPWFLLLPAVVTAFLFLHATGGWCPPLPILRRMGKRTRNEIDVEKFAIKAIRGDFNDLNFHSDQQLFINRVIDAVRAYRA